MQAAAQIYRVMRRKRVTVGHLAELMDADRSGRITRKEFTRGQWEGVFQHLLLPPHASFLAARS